MSLINEALKKAQRQRSLQNAPLSSAPSGVAAAAVSTHERSASHRSSRAPLYFGLGLLVLGAGATALVMHYGFSPDTPPAPAPAAPTLASAAAPLTPVAPAAPVATAPAESGVVLPPITHAAPSPAPAAPASVTPVPTPPKPPAVAVVTSSPTPAPVTAPAIEAAPAEVAPIPPAPLTPAEREARIYATLSAARLAGVRGLDAQARVLMNEKVYRLNDTVDAELGLRLSAVRPGLLIFTDAQGKTYEKVY